jgi:hypothetical protein
MKNEDTGESLLLLLDSMQTQAAEAEPGEGASAGENDKVNQSRFQYAPGMLPGGVKVG